MIKGYKTIKETAEEWNISTRRLQVLCTEGRIEGAAKLGREWAIPVNAEKPSDKRVVSGKYKNWRNPTKRAEEKNTCCGGTYENAN